MEQRQKDVLNLVTSPKITWRTIQRIERKFAKNRFRKYFPFRISERHQFFSELKIRHPLHNSELEVTMITTKEQNTGLAGSKNTVFERAIVVIAQP